MENEVVYAVALEDVYLDKLRTILEWLDANDIEPYHKRTGFFRFVFVFANKTDAIKFKLTFGGKLDVITFKLEFGGKLDVITFGDKS